MTKLWTLNWIVQLYIICLKIFVIVYHLFFVFSIRSTDTVGAEVYTDMLLKNTTPYITTNVSWNYSIHILSGNKPFRT